MPAGKLLSWPMCNFQKKIPHLSFENMTSEDVKQTKSKLSRAAAIWTALQLTSPSTISAPSPAAFVLAFDPRLLPLAGSPGLLIFSSPLLSPDTALCLVFLFTLPTSNFFRDGRSGPSSFSSVNFFWRLLRPIPSVPAGGTVVLSFCVFRHERTIERLCSDGWPVYNFQKNSTLVVRKHDIGRYETDEKQTGQGSDNMERPSTYIPFHFVCSVSCGLCSRLRSPSSSLSRSSRALDIFSRCCRQTLHSVSCFSSLSLRLPLFAIAGAVHRSMPYSIQQI